MSDASFYSRDFHHFLPKAGDEEPGRVYWLYKPHFEPWYQGRLVVVLVYLRLISSFKFCVRDAHL